MKTYKIEKRKIIEFLEDKEDYTIELYKDGSYSVLPIKATGYPDDALCRADVEYYDFEDCDEDLECYFIWLENCFFSISTEIGCMVDIV